MQCVPGLNKEAMNFCKATQNTLQAQIVDMKSIFEHICTKQEEKKDLFNRIKKRVGKLKKLFEFFSSHQRVAKLFVHNW